MKKGIICICLLFGAINILAQKDFQVGPQTQIEIPANVSVRNTLLVKDYILVVGNIRSASNDTDVFLAYYDKEGKQILNRTIGLPTAFERYGSIIMVADNYYLLITQVSKTTKIILYQLDQDLNEITQTDFSSLNRFSGNSLTVMNNSILIGIQHIDQKGNNFPEIIKYNLENKTISVRELSAVNATTSLEDKPESHFYIDAQGNKVEPSKELLEEINNSLKVQNKLVNKQVQSVSVFKNEIYIVGAEKTKNFSDFWVGKLNPELEIVWEKVYEKANDSGADVLHKAIELSNGNIATVGQNYNKPKGLDYSLAMDQIKPDGSLVNPFLYSMGTDEHFIDAYKTNKGIILFGYADYEPVKEFVGDNVIDRNICFVKVARDGSVLNEVILKRPGFQQLLTVSQLSEKEFGLLFKSTTKNHSEWFFQMITIN